MKNENYFIDLNYSKLYVKEFLDYGDQSVTSSGRSCGKCMQYIAENTCRF